MGFIGDPHDGRMRGLLGVERGDRAHARLWQSQIQHLRDHRCTHAVIVGDVFDTPFPDQDQLLRVTMALARADDLKFLVYLGNHDVYDASSNSLKLLCRMPEAGALGHVKFVMDPAVVKWGGVRVRVVPWDARLPDGDGVDVTVHHNSVVGAKMDNGMSVPVGGGLSRDKLGFSVGGHLHTPQPGFCGTGAQLSFGERPEKSVSVIDFDARTPKVETHPIKTPWVLETAKWNSDDPPACDAEGTYYRLVLSGDQPPPRWLVEHPRVVRMQGAPKRAQAQVGKVVVDGGKGVDTEDDGALLSRYLRSHTNLDNLDRVRAMKLHERMRRA